MRYLPPREWPPTHRDRPPVDDWSPPEGWSPPRNMLPLSPDGIYKLVRSPNTDGAAAPSDDELDEIQKQIAERMLGIWARTVQKDTHSYYQAATHATWIDKAIDYGEDWSPDVRELTEELEEVWIRGYRLLTSNQQMERWLQAHQRLHGEAEEKSEYAALRNTLEHLDEAHFDELTARRSPSGRKWQSIAELPGSELFLGFSSTFIENAFGVANLKKIFNRARTYSRFGLDDSDNYEPSWEDLQGLRYGPSGDEDGE